MKIICPEPNSFSQMGLDFASKNFDLFAKKMDYHEFMQQSKNFDAALIRFNTKIDSKLLLNSKIKYIISPTTGLDHIDFLACKRQKIKVFHLRGEKSFLKKVTATAELTFALIFSTIRRIEECQQSVKSGKWSAENLMGHELSGKNLGIIGCGRLGRKVARIGLALDMKVFIYDPYLKRFPSGVTICDDITSLYKKSDILTIHIPLNDETHHLIDENSIEFMKQGVVLINTSRGSIIKTDAILKGLKSGRVSFAGLDVIENEHSFMGSKHPLVAHAINNSNLVITPHIGGSTYESVEKTDLFILNKFLKHINKKI